jgi:signal transduction histidine kinase
VQPAGASAELLGRWTTRPRSWIVSSAARRQAGRDLSHAFPGPLATTALLATLAILGAAGVGLLVVQDLGLPLHLAGLVKATLAAAWLTVTLGAFAMLVRRLLREERLLRGRLAAELATSTHELQVSRRRLLDAAVSERQRLQRDLHDSAQQQLVSMRVKLGLAQSSLRKDRRRTERLLGGLQSELETALQEVRALANGVYPPVLTQYGLEGSLDVVRQRAARPVALHTDGLRRYARDVEGAVYFTCAEAIQNAEKHAGKDAEVSMRLWQEGDRLRFAVVDSGVGIDEASVEGGRGLLNMRDRIEAVGGTLTIRSKPRLGTTVAGTVPLGGPRR